MTLQICVSPNLITPTLDRKLKDNVARKSGYKQVHGEVYKQRTRWKKICDFIAASKSPNVIGKAFFESKQFSEAAIIRKDFQAGKQEITLKRPLTDDEYDATVWNSNGVQNRLTRQDYTRYNQNHRTKEQGACNRNLWAQRFAKLSHSMHGLCEINAAPTGMTYNVTRNTMAAKVDDKSTKNKIMMFGLLAFIGVASNGLLNLFRQGAKDAATIAGQAVSGVFIAFPAFSSCLGLAGAMTGLTSQLLVKKQELTQKQKEVLSSNISKNLEKLLSQLKGIKNKPELIQVMAKAMQGKYHLFKKISSNHLDAQGVPKILNQALEAINPAKSDIDNMLAIKNALGEYLQVEKPAKDKASLWARYRYCKAVTTLESHYVALMGTVDHLEIENPHKTEHQDGRRWLEENAAPTLHKGILHLLSLPAAIIDKVANTKIAPTLRKWASASYQNEHAEKMKNPNRAAKNCFSGAYMANHIHQYGPITRAFIKFAEGVRLVNLNIVLSSNGNLSRLFNNIAQIVCNTLGTGPAPRSICFSVGRFFGGALLAVAFGVGIPAIAQATGGSVDVNPGGVLPVDLSLSNIGILMFILATPTLLAQGVAQIVARLEGWNGNLPKTASRHASTFNFSR